MDVVLASNNKNKYREIKEILKKFRLRCFSLADAGIDIDIDETGETLKENAAIKARAVRNLIKDKIIIADDTGLEVDYLAGAPGVYSARFAGPECSYLDNNIKLLKIMRGVPKNQRKAVFKTVIHIIFPDGYEKSVIGKVKGLITENMRGENGFGYDPVFYLPSLKKTYAELNLSQKNKVSHRMQAICAAGKLINSYLKKYSTQINAVVFKTPFTNGK